MSVWDLPYEKQPKPYNSSSHQHRTPVPGTSHRGAKSGHNVHRDSGGQERFGSRHSQSQHNGNRGGQNFNTKK